MANDDALSARGGLLPVSFPYGNFRKTYYRLTTSAVAVYIGQPMDLDTNGQAVMASVGTTKTVIVGPVVGFARDINGKAALPDVMLDVTAGPYLPALTNGYVCIADDPNQIFVIQEGTAATQLTTASISGCGTFSYLRATSGNTTTGYSYAELDADQFATITAGSGNLTVLGLADNINSDGSWNALGQYAKWKVQIMNHRYANAQ